MPRGHVLPDGHKIAALRGEADLTQWQLAAEAGYALRTISKIESSKPTGASTLAAAATVLSRRLRRPIQLADLIQRFHGDSGECICADEATPLVEEAIKFLDLSHSLPAGRNGPSRENRIVLFDHYRFSRLPESQAVLTFPYGTIGQCIPGQCLTHPEAGEWYAEPHPSRRSQCTEDCGIRIDLKKLGAAVRWVFQNRVEYINPFVGQNQECFHADIVYPTRCLSLVALFPTSRPCKSIRASYRRQGGPFLQLPEGPIRIPDGRMLHWHLPSPALGATYRLEWEW